MRAAAVSALLFAVAGCAITRPYYGEPLPTEAEVLVAHAADGVDLPVIHYQPDGPVRGLPIVLCHGISSNARHMDLDAEHSLARWFAARGRETFAMSLRGTDDALLPAGAHRADLAKVDFDTYPNQDLPAVLRLVRQKTGAAQVDFIGHSMGGMMLYAYLAQGGTGIHAAATLGSPVRLNVGGRFEALAQSRVARVVSRFDAMPMAALAGLLVPVAGDLDTPLEKLLVNLHDVDETTWQKLVVSGTADIPGGVLRQLIHDMAIGRFASADGEVDYLAGLSKVTTPILVVAGKADHLALASAVKPAYRALAGKKRFFIAGVESGFAHDYGHVDLTVGARAPDELWPVIARWLDAP